MNEFESLEQKLRQLQPIRLSPTLRARCLEPRPSWRTVLAQWLSACFAPRVVGWAAGMLLLVSLAWWRGYEHHKLLAITANRLLASETTPVVGATDNDELAPLTELMGQVQSRYRAYRRGLNLMEPGADSQYLWRKRLGL